MTPEDKEVIRQYVQQYCTGIERDIRDLRRKLLQCMWAVVIAGMILTTTFLISRW